MTDNTQRSFWEKWKNNEDLAFKVTLDPKSEIHRWILSRNGFDTDADLSGHLSRCRRILDAGCGNGRVTALLRRLAPPEAKVIGVDLVAADVARRNLAELPNVRIEEADLLGDLRGLGRFDFIYCQEVLHHATDPRGAFLNLAGLLAPGGEIAIYVYRKKAPVREFTDDFVRSRIADMPYEQAMAVCRAITEMGRALSGIEGTVRVPEIPVLGIEAGEYSAQRFIYHFFCKCFWNTELKFEENAAINYDWYHPQIATRHTLDEVRAWFATAKLDVIHECVDPYGITVRGVRN
jgi:SAM-dependent methyltransferase